MKTCFSGGKLMKQFETSPRFLRSPLLSTNTPISEHFFQDPLILWGGGGRELCVLYDKHFLHIFGSMLETGN